MRRRPIVWAGQDYRRLVNGKLVSVHDTSKAEKFGERRFVLSERVKPWAPTKAAGEIRAALVDYRADLDYLLLLGSPVFVAMMFATACDRAAHDDHSHVQLLYWHNRDQDYAELLVGLDDVIGFEWPTA